VRVYRNVGDWDKCLDLVMVGDGYRQSDLDDGTYWRDVERIASGVLKVPPFCWHPTDVNVRAVFLPSLMEGCDISWDRDRVDTALDSAFDGTKGRGLHVRDVAALREALWGRATSTGCSSW
jgi:hypothetical protein